MKRLFGSGLAAAAARALEDDVLVGAFEVLAVALPAPRGVDRDVGVSVARASRTRAAASF